jgi:hypothetical protein
VFQSGTKSGLRGNAVCCSLGRSMVLDPIAERVNATFAKATQTETQVVSQNLLAYNARPFVHKHCEWGGADTGLERAMLRVSTEAHTRAHTIA